MITDFFHDSVECQQYEHISTSKWKLIRLPHNLYRTFFSFQISIFLLDTKGPIISTSQNKSSIYVFDGVFSHFLVPVPIAQWNPLTLKQLLQLFNIIGVSNLAG